MFEVIRYQIGQDEQLFHKYKSDIGKLAMLMRHEGTALERMVDWIEFSRFQFVEHDLKQLAEPLYQWFQEHHPQKLPAFVFFFFFFFRRFFFFFFFFFFLFEVFKSGKGIL